MKQPSMIQDRASERNARVLSPAATGIGTDIAGGALPLLGVDARAYGVPEALAADIALLDRLLGQVLAGEQDGAINTLAQQLYQESLRADSEQSMGNQSASDIFERFPALR